MASTWTPLHIYLHGGAEQADTLLREHIGPYAAAALRRGAIRSWFFLRYWEGGPHLRWRLADATPEAVGEARRMLDTALRELPAPKSTPDPSGWYATVGRTDDGTRHGWRAHGEVVVVPYEPEVDRYGGPAAIGAAEALFAAASQVALALLRRPADDRSAACLDLIFAMVAAAGFDDAEAATFLRACANHWTRTDEGVGADIGLGLIAAEADWHARGPAYRRRRTEVAARVAAGVPSLATAWAERVASYVAGLRALGPRLRAPLAAVLGSQLHMLHNRVGLTVAEECQLAWLASFAYVRGDGDFHAAGPDRDYHDGSKFTRAGWPDQQPRDVGYMPPPRWPGAARVALPAGTGLDTVPLGAALAARRSDYRWAPGALAAQTVGDLLRLPAGGDAHRSYPSAGALFPARVLVWARDVDGVPPAVYTYRPDDHALEWTAPAPDDARFARVSPQLDPVFAPVPLDTAAVPLWLFVAADVAVARRKYGRRGYRFAALEAGHLTQNLLLAAAALDLSTVAVGGFFDDLLHQLLVLDGVDEVACYAIPVGRRVTEGSDQ